MQRSGLRLSLLLHRCELALDPLKDLRLLRKVPAHIAIGTKEEHVDPGQDDKDRSDCQGSYEADEEIELEANAKPADQAQDNAEDHLEDKQNGNNSTDLGTRVIENSHETPPQPRIGYQVEAI